MSVNLYFVKLDKHVVSNVEMFFVVWACALVKGNKHQNILPWQVKG